MQKNCRYHRKPYRGSWIFNAGEKGQAFSRKFLLSDLLNQFISLPKKVELHSHKILWMCRNWKSNAFIKTGTKIFMTGRLCFLVNFSQLRQSFSSKLAFHFNTDAARPSWNWFTLRLMQEMSEVRGWVNWGLAGFNSRKKKLSFNEVKEKLHFVPEA